jgi:hypothetical protein
MGQNVNEQGHGIRRMLTVRLLACIARVDVKARRLVLFPVGLEAAFVGALFCCAT